MIFSMVVVGVLSSPDAAAFGALLASMTAVMVAWFQGHKAAGAATQASDLIATNSGMRPGEYLELIGKIHGTLALLDGKVDTLVDSQVDHDWRLRRLEGGTHRGNK